MSEEKIKMCYYNKTEPCLVFNISGFPMTQIEICNACKKKRKLSFDEIVNGMDEAITSLKKNNYQCELRQSQAENQRLREALIQLKRSIKTGYKVAPAMDIIDKALVE